MLFYSSVVLGLIFTAYGSVVIGLLEIVTFAGAVSVMLLTAVLMTGESDLGMGASAAKASLAGAALVAGVAASSLVLGQIPAGRATAQPLSPTSVIQFIWLERPWDLLILLMVFASSMVVVVNLFSKEGQ